MTPRGGAGISTRSSTTTCIDPAFGRLRDAYLEPWGGGVPRHVVPDALVVGTFARAIGSLGHRAVMPADRRGGYDEWLGSLLRRGLAVAGV